MLLAYHWIECAVRTGDSLTLWFEITTNTKNWIYIKKKRFFVWKRTKVQLCMCGMCSTITFRHTRTHLRAHDYTDTHNQLLRNTIIFHFPFGYIYTYFRRYLVWLVAWLLLLLLQLLQQYYHLYVTFLLSLSKNTRISTWTQQQQQKAKRKRK